jgi:prepilin-type N-terminal cleavage/methylation domain-containing protein
MLLTGHSQPAKISLEGIQKTHAFAATQGPRSKSYAAFTLLELLVVVVIMCVMMSLLAPAVGSMTSPVGRKGAVTIVMNTLEQARVSAIETGRETVVLFWKKNGVAGFPPDEPDSLMILRKNEAGSWESISRWVKLPNGVLLDGAVATGSEILKNAAITLAPSLPSLAGSPDINQLRFIQFTTSGAVMSPSTSSAGLYIAFTEGQRATGTDDLQPNKQKSGGKEVISLARYTGRSTMDIVDLQ